MQPTIFSITAFAFAKAVPLKIAADRGRFAFALLPGAYDVAERFLLGRRDVHGGERAGAKRESEITGIAAVGLDPVAGAFGDQRGRRHDAVLGLTAQVALEPEPARARLVDELQASAPGEFLDQAINRILLGADGPDIDGWVHRDATHTGDGDGVFVNVETDEDSGIVSHADLRMREPTLSVHNRRSCGSGNALTRDKGLAEVSALPRESHTV
jgi:hypothetical protein